MIFINKLIIRGIAFASVLCLVNAGFAQDEPPATGGVDNFGMEDHSQECVPENNMQALQTADFNGDGAVEQADIELIIEAVATNKYQAFYDLNNDGKLKEKDVEIAIGDDGKESSLLDQTVAKLYQNVQKYQDIGAAVRDGFIPFTQEYQNHGYHMIRFFNFNTDPDDPWSRVNLDETIDVTRPEGLNYDRFGNLVGVFFYKGPNVQLLMPHVADICGFDPVERQFLPCTTEATGLGDDQINQLKGYGQYLYDAWLRGGDSVAEVKAIAGTFGMKFKPKAPIAVQEGLDPSNGEANVNAYYDADDKKVIIGLNPTDGSFYFYAANRPISGVGGFPLKGLDEDGPGQDHWHFHQSICQRNIFPAAGEALELIFGEDKITKEQAFSIANSIDTRQCDLKIPCIEDGGFALPRFFMLHTWMFAENNRCGIFWGTDENVSFDAGVTKKERALIADETSSFVLEPGPNEEANEFLLLDRAYEELYLDGNGDPVKNKNYRRLCLNPKIVGYAESYEYVRQLISDAEDRFYNGPPGNEGDIDVIQTLVCPPAVVDDGATLIREPEEGCVPHPRDEEALKAVLNVNQ